MKRVTRTDKQILMNELVSQAGQDEVIFGTNKPPPKEADIQEAARDLAVNTILPGKDQSSHHHAQQRVEVLSVQHRDQAEDLPKLCDVHAKIWL